MSGDLSSDELRAQVAAYLAGSGGQAPGVDAWEPEDPPSGARWWPAVVVVFHAPLSPQLLVLLACACAERALTFSDDNPTPHKMLQAIRNWADGRGTVADVHALDRAYGDATTKAMFGEGNLDALHAVGACAEALTSEAGSLMFRVGLRNAVREAAFAAGGEDDEAKADVEKARQVELMTAILLGRA